MGCSKPVNGSLNQLLFTQQTNCLGVYDLLKDGPNHLMVTVQSAEQVLSGYFQ